MHRKQVDCRNGKIYKIISNNPDIKEVYYGSTIQTLCGRMRGHRSTYKRWLAGKSGGGAVCDLFEKYGVEQFHIELVELFPCEVEAQLYTKENEYIRGNECVNKHSAISTPAELKQWQKKYDQEHKDHRNKWEQDHKEHLLAYRKKYQQEHKEEFSQIITCECGCEITKGCLPRHLKSKKHLSLMFVPT